MEETPFKTTAYFRTIRTRSDRAIIENRWILQAIDQPIYQVVQSDGRIRRWAKIVEADNRYLRVTLLPDQESVHNAFFDRRFKERAQ
jgi:hypothetical protein